VAARDELRRVLDRLAPRARAILVLRYYADLDDAAIADSMGIRASSVRATVSRALAALRLDVTRGDREELR
jgi:RNA polymerase sigma factor (sigma-70 family)